jgi:hypothetical protein
MAGHLFVDEMKTFNDPSHAKHLVRRSSVCKGAIIVGAEDSGYSRRVGGMPPARPDGAGARLDSSNPPMTPSGHSRNLRPSRRRSALTSIADMPLRCGPLESWLLRHAVFTFYNLLPSSALCDLHWRSAGRHFFGNSRWINWLVGIYARILLYRTRA